MNFVEVQMEEVKLTLDVEEWLGFGWAKRGRDVVSLEVDWVLYDLLTI